MALALAVCPALCATAVQAQDGDSPDENTPENTPEVTVHASDDGAQRAFAQGRDAYLAGRFEEALEQYTEAYDLAPHAELLFNLGNTHDRLGQPEPALRRYREYRAARPLAENADFVSGRIEILERQLESSDEVGGPTPPSSNPVPRQAREPDQTPAILVFSLAGLTGLGGLGTGIGSFLVRSDIQARCTNAGCPGTLRSDADTMQALAIATDVLLGLSLTSFAIALILALTTEADREVAVSCEGAICEAEVRF